MPKRRGPPPRVWHVKVRDSARRYPDCRVWGRLTSEMVIKCAQMAIPFLVSRSGLTQMGYEVARKTGITMLGRASGRHYLAFTGRERLVRRAPQPTAVV